jgi:N-acetylglutamate synthase-like GNAT family acetyltransferase
VCCKRPEHSQLIHIGAALLRAMVAHARALGHPYVYCGTSTAESLLQRSGWSPIEVIEHAGQPLTVFRSAAQPLAQAERQRQATGARATKALTRH